MYFPLFTYKKLILGQKNLLFKVDKKQKSDTNILEMGKCKFIEYVKNR